MLQYLEEFRLLTSKEEEDFLFKNDQPLLTSRYPFNVFRYRELPPFVFGPVTIFCGGNGSGKSTVLNVIAEKLQLKRGAVYNRSEMFEDYVRRCEEKVCYGTEIPPESKIITSDDVFDYLLDVRYLNIGIDNKREELFDSYFYNRYREENTKLRSLDDYDRWKEVVAAQKGKRPNPNTYVKSRVMDNIRERSNGESALMYFTQEIKENALYLLDEPENSLSAEFQIELKTFLEASVRAFNCQFIISTHSPFLLAMEGATIYDLDAAPPKRRKWTEIKNVRIYHDFFALHHDEF